MSTTPHKDITELIGNTPLVRLTRLSKPDAATIYGKVEFFNPGGSVKDRPALNMILDGERTGRLTPDRVILDSTSGNTGIAYAMIGAARGYKVKLCLPSNASPERRSACRCVVDRLGSTNCWRPRFPIGPLMYLRVRPIKETPPLVTTLPRMASVAMAAALVSQLFAIARPT